MTHPPENGESGLTARERSALEQARRVSHVMDDAFRIPGIDVRFGLDPVIGIAPISGDAVSALASLYIVLQAVRVGAPMRTVATMLLLVGADAVVGSIPLIGTLLDGVIKVNNRNAELLETHVHRAARRRNATGAVTH